MYRLRPADETDDRLAGNVNLSSIPGTFAHGRTIAGYLLDDDTVEVTTDREGRAIRLELRRRGRFLTPTARRGIYRVRGIIAVVANPATAAKITDRFADALEERGLEVHGIAGVTGGTAYVANLATLHDTSLSTLAGMAPMLPDAIDLEPWHRWRYLHGLAAVTSPFTLAGPLKVTGA